jgi:hypothetical protein
MKYMQAAQEPSESVGPLASRAQPTSDRSASVLAPVPDEVADDRVGLADDGTQVESHAGLAVVGDAQQQQDAMSRVVQGLATGIGFLGAGAILKLESNRRIRGLTTAAGVWMTAAVGVTIGLGQLGTAAIGTLIAWIVLALLIRVDKRIEGSDDTA